MVARVYGDDQLSLWSQVRFRPANNLRQLRLRIDLDRVGHRDCASRLVIDWRLDVLQKRSAAINIQYLQAIANAEYWLAHVVGILQEQFIDGIALGIGSIGLGVLGSVVLSRVYVG